MEGKVVEQNTRCIQGPVIYTKITAYVKHVRFKNIPKQKIRNHERTKNLKISEFYKKMLLMIAYFIM